MPLKSEREVLEDAIVADPEDRAAHAAYADLLADQGDPRGEFMRVQLALEDEAVPAGQRKELQQRERELLEAHEREWLGPLAPLLLGPAEGQARRRSLDPNTPRWRFVRGLLAGLTFPRLDTARARALVAAGPETRFVRRLSVDDAAYDEDEDEDVEYGDDEEAEPVADFLAETEYAALRILLRWPGLASLRALRLGEEVDEDYGGACPFHCQMAGDYAHEYVKRTPRLEELYLLAHRVDTARLFALPVPNLRVLQVYHNDEYPLEELAANPTLGRLTHLLCHPHAPVDDPPITLERLRAVCRSPHLRSLAHLRLRLTTFGDEGVREVIRSGLLKRLRSLDLRHGRVSDDGARLLAGSRDARNLEHLDLLGNELTGEGVQALAGLGIRVEAGHQHASTADMGDNEVVAEEFLSQGDWE